MKFEVELTKRADRDLRNIYEYIAFELQAQENANGQLNNGYISGNQKRLSLFSCPFSKIKKDWSGDINETLGRK